MIDAIGRYYPHLMQGLVVTLLVALSSLALGLMLALVLAPAAVYGPRWLRYIIAAYVGLIRGLPELLVIFLVFYGGTVLLSALIGSYVEVHAFSAGVAALSVVSSAYLAEILRGALLSVPQGQWEASLALGLSRPSAFRLVVLPQMMIRALPGLGNQWLIILKESALVSVVGLEELMRKSVIAAGATHQPLAFYLLAAALYVAVTGVSTLGINGLRTRLTPHLR